MTSTEQATPRWDYGSERGPARWGSLAEAYSTCSCGRFQSPIALSEREALRFEYASASAPFELKSNIAQWKRFEPFPPGIQPPTATFEQYIPPPPPIVGDVPPVTGFEAPPPAATLILRELPPELPKEGKNGDASAVVAEAPAPLRLNDAQAQQYRLVNIHFHAPQSEHIIEQVRGDLEMHAVFRNVSDENDVAVIGRIFRAVPDEPTTAHGSMRGSSFESPTVPRWLDGLLSLLDEPSADMPAKLDASSDGTGHPSVTFTANTPGGNRAGVRDSSAAQASTDAATFAGSTRTGGLRATRYVEFNFADALFHDVTSRASSVTSPANEIESGMALAAEELDPEARPSFFYYRGSLTMPPCSENIKWIVLTHRDPLPKRVVERILAAQLGQPNVRPLQPRNERSVLYYTPDGLGFPPAPSGSTQKGS
jgi:carbonic anhydrase